MSAATCAKQFLNGNGVDTDQIAVIPGLSSWSTLFPKKDIVSSRNQYIAKVTNT
jgi:hypothetical protein